MEIGAQLRMMQREQLRRNQAAQVGAALDVVGLGDAAIERLAAQRARVLLEAADQPRELAELRDCAPAAARVRAARPPTGVRPGRIRG